MNVINMNECDLGGGTLYNEVCQCLANLRISVSQYFLNDQYMIFQYHVWIKDAIKDHDRPVDLGNNVQKVY